MRGTAMSEPPSQPNGDEHEEEKEPEIPEPRESPENE